MTRVIRVDDVLKALIALKYYPSISSSYITSLSLSNLDWQESIVSEVNFVTSEPGSPADGDRYINTTTGTSSGTSTAVTATYIYEWVAASSSWSEVVPDEGTTAWIEDTDIPKSYNAGSWVNLATVMDHGDLLGRSDDDHTQYLLLAGRVGGQDIIAESTSVVTVGDGTYSIGFFAESPTLNTRHVQHGNSCGIYANHYYDGASFITENTGFTGINMVLTPSAINIDGYVQFQGRNIANSNSGVYFRILPNTSQVKLISNGPIDFTTATGVSTSVRIGDPDVARTIFYHDGSDGYITTSSGNLQVSPSGDIDFNNNAVVNVADLTSIDTITADSFTDGVFTATGGVFSGVQGITTIDLIVSDELTVDSITDGVFTATGGVFTGVSSITATTFTDGVLSISGGDISSADLVTSTSFTDGTFTATGGVFTDVQNFTSVGTITGDALTDGTFTTTGGVLSGAISLDIVDITATGDIIADSFSDGVFTATGGAFTSVGSLSDGTLSFTGGTLTNHRVPFVAKTDSYVLTLNDEYVTASAGTQAVDITLPTASGITGKLFGIKAIDITNTVNVLPDGAETIDTATGYNFSSQHEAIVVVSNGSDWHIF